MSTDDVSIADLFGPAATIGSIPVTVSSHSTEINSMWVVTSAGTSNETGIAFSRNKSIIKNPRKSFPNNNKTGL